MSTAKPFSPDILKGDSSQRVFAGENLTQIAFPLGGIGAGTVCMSGIGGIKDYSIMNKPDTTAKPDAHETTPSAFAMLHIKEDKATRLVEGPMPVEWIYNQGLKGQGYRGGGQEGLPRFRNCTFTGEYPFGTIELSDPDIPLTVHLNAFNPFIPLDDLNSGIPCAILEYTIKNPTTKKIEFEFSYHISHLAPGISDFTDSCTRNEVIPGKGVYLYNTDPKDETTFGSCSLSVINHTPVIKAMWFRGGWFDSISALWREVSTGSFIENDGKDAEKLNGRNGGSILLKGSLEPGESITYPIVITWYFPNINFSVGQAKGSNCCSSENSSCCSGNSKATCWHPYYATRWTDARDVTLYIHKHFDYLRKQTQTFHDDLFSSSLPSYILDAISANLGIIKSPTVIRQENGHMWGWEGCFSNQGCCHGSCTHVWNYAQSIPHLFPQLERTLREQELTQSMNEEGHITFRSALPEGPTEHDFHAASDGQLGGIMKLYREWQISGDTEWVKKLYPLAKRSMDFCIRIWDPRHEGVLEEPHHNTYDIEFWGPDGMCSSFYIGALYAFSLLAKGCGHTEDSPFYEDLARKGSTYLDKNLFNGEYFQQNVRYDDLNDQSFNKFIASVDDSSPYEHRLVKAEGPKYQYGIGCISDGVLGAWLAKNCFIESPQNRENIRKNLASIFTYNFKESLWDHSNPQRPGYAIGDEPGLLLCTWPHGNKPTLPFVYSDEVWTGIEYQVASHLISEGLVEEGLTIVKALRSRHNGKVRNPWNEYECGNYYARAMASYALLSAFSGFQYSAVEKALIIHPKINQDNFTTFFCTASAWGTIHLENNELKIELSSGTLDIKTLAVRLENSTKKMEIDTVVKTGQPVIIKISAK